MYTTEHIRFTVVVPVLNAAKTIKATLDSLLSQTYVSFEVLIRDGCSTDETLPLVKQYTNTDSRFQCVSEKDNGIYDAMNKAIADAKGEWIFFLGSDDSLFDNKVFSEVVATIRKSQDAKLVYGNVQLNRPLGYHHQDLIYAGEFDADKLLKKNICHQSVFYHRSLFRQFGLYRTEYRIFADYDFNLRCFNRVKSVYLDRIIANFNVGGHSKNQQNLDSLFEKDFTANMILHYAFPCTSSFYNGRKKELLSLATKKFGLRHLKGTAKAFKILSYQAVRRLAGNKRSSSEAIPNN